MSELKKCPFCGKMPKVNSWTMHGIAEQRCFCDNEQCPVYLSKTIALDDWNTRPIEDALNARIAELEAAQRWHVVKECNDVATPIDVALRKRIAKLEAVIDQLIEAGEKMFTAVIAAAVPYDEGMREWDKIVNDWKEG